MENHNGEMHVETDSARGGSTPNIVRWVLGFSLLAAIILLSAIWMTGAWVHDGGDDPAANGGAGGQAAENATGGILKGAPKQGQ